MRYEVNRARRCRRAPASFNSLAANPDRIALWAFLLAVVMIVMAVASANGAVGFG